MMTNNVGTIAKQQYPTNRPPQSEKLEDLVNCDVETLELTEVEAQAAINEALEKKKQIVRTMQYNHKLRTMPKGKEFSKEEYWHRYIDLAKEKFGDKMEIDAESEKIIKTLCLYFARDKHFETLGFSLRKGICLVGPVGCYKTTIMRFLQLNQVISYRVIGVRDIANEYADVGHDVIKKYTKHSELGYESDQLFRQRFGGWCFDDLGTEDEKKNFGNQANVMQNILLNRYDSGMGFEYTHITTNLTSDGIISYYGERLASRMREMFNIVEFSHNAKDKRR